MPKGRHYAPSTDKDGIWYRHRGLQKPGPIPILRENVTSTGLMLTAPFDPDVSSYPPAPPQPYIKKDARKFKTVNTFSSHDNRNSFQNHGVYFGNGRDTRFLGRHLTAPESRQHNTERDFLKHYGREQSRHEYNTVYTKNYERKACQTAPSHRRFGKSFPELQSGLTKLTTTTTSVYREPDVPHKTPTNVLAVSQEPFLGVNNWKYSYHGLAKCYPPYDRLDRRLKHIPTWLLPRATGSDCSLEKTMA